MNTNDDELDDASMKSMRAVWLTMRDEEPPSSGMSALLAAAREKAEQMTQPSWFERTFGFLRKPPALAFATVMILIGGAVMVTRNTADKKTDAETSNAAPVATPEPERSRDDFAGKQQMATDEPTPPPTMDPHAGSGEVAIPTTIESPPPEPPTIKTRPRTPPKLLKKKPSATPDVSEDRPTGNIVVDKPTDPAKDSNLELGGVREGVQGRGDTPGTKVGTDASPPHVEPTAPPPPPPTEKRPVVKQEEPADDADQVTVTGTKKPTTPPVEQLKNQAESAASRGDCTAVKVIVARIKKQDESYYKTRVTTNATIKKCL